MSFIKSPKLPEIKPLVNQTRYLAGKTLYNVTKVINYIIYQIERESFEYRKRI